MASHRGALSVNPTTRKISIRKANKIKLRRDRILNPKLIKICIPELSLIVTVNSFQVVEMLIIQPQSQALKVLKHFILAPQEESPRITRIVINNDNDNNIPLTSHGANPRGTDSVHME
jgi:hypothetical protein